MDTVDHACETLDLAWRLLRLNGLGASDLVRLSSAHTNDVYRADEAYVVRICRTPGSEHRLRAEAELLRRIRDTVPVQPVVACGVVDGAAYQILGYIEGQSLSRCWHTLSRAGIESMARDLAAHLRSLHALTQDGFGYFSVPAVTGTTWRDFILGMFGQLRDGILQGPVDACVSEALDEAGRYLRIHAGCLDGGGSARTIHNDL
ncbi:MAG TPA: phosphotransferase, partial [Arenibaculum sp.]|nr:phosphotransferase [Arenibaculum sp.]